MANRTLVVDGIDVLFPFEPYPVQLEYMTKVVRALRRSENALLESPTGTGKTLCLLCASLALLRHLRSAVPLGGAAPRKMRVLYTSRTHAQLSQVVREFKRTVYAKEFSMAVLGSRDRLCVDNEVSKISNAGTQNFMCQAKVASNECRYYRKTRTFLSPNGELRQPQAAEVLDIEELYAAGRREHFCPYYLQRAAAAVADIVFVPYPYIFDRNVRRQLGIDLSECFLLIDEAHNVPGFISSSTCQDLTSLDLARSIGEVSQAVAVVRAPEMAAQAAEEGEDSGVVEEELSTLKLLLLNLEKNVHGEALSGSAVHRPGTFMLEFLGRLGIASGEPVKEFQRVVSKAVQLLTQSNVPCTGLQKVMAFVDLIFAGDRDPEVLDSAYRFVLQERERAPPTHNTGATHHEQTVRSLGFWCLDTAVVLSPTLSEAPAVVLTSGTLSPMEHFALELGIAVPHLLQGTHVIGPDQTIGVVCCRGPGDVVLNASFSQRESEVYKTALGMSLLNVARLVREGGLLVFFPSYAALHSISDHWRTRIIGSESRTVWAMLTDLKKVFVEPKSSNELDEVVAAFKSEAERSSALLLAVCRGKVSEGVDFADRHGRCVVVTGIPFANSADLFVKLKREYLTRVAAKRPRVHGSLFTGDVWYQQEAMRTVNQSIGRVIRHKDDYGAIVLADERFAHQLNGLAAWVRRTVTVAQHFGDAHRLINQFFARRQRQDRQEPATRASTGREERANADGTLHATGLSAICVEKAHEFISHAREEEASKAQREVTERWRALEHAGQSPSAAEDSTSATTGMGTVSVEGEKPLPPRRAATLFQRSGIPRPPTTNQADSSTAAPAARPSVGSATTEGTSDAAMKFCNDAKAALSPEKYQQLKPTLVQILRTARTASSLDDTETKRRLDEGIDSLRDIFLSIGAEAGTKWLDDLAAFLPLKFRPYYARAVRGAKPPTKRARQPE